MFKRYDTKLLFSPDPETGGGGNPNPNPQTPDDKTKHQQPDLAKENAELKSQLEAINARLAKLDFKDTPPPQDDLANRARLAREQTEKNLNNTKALEAAISFNMNAEKFLRDNASLLPKEINDIFAQANKETYDSAIDKTAAIKAGVIQSFFAIQANQDLLTPGLKSKLDDYLKLTNTSKQEKALQLYDEIFEPAFEMLKRVKKAEALGKGYGGNSSDDAYKNKMMTGSKKHYLGESK